MSKDPKQEFTDVMQELDAFAKAHVPTTDKAASPKETVAKSQPAQAVKEEAGSHENGQAQDGQFTELTADASPSIDAEEFVAKANVLLSETVKGLITPQQQATVLVAKALVAQGQVLQSLAEQVRAIQEETEKIGNQPGVRKSVVSVHDRQPSGQAPMQEDNGHMVLKSVLSKQEALLKQGAIGPVEVAELEYAFNRGQGLPPRFQHLAQYANA